MKKRFFTAVDYVTGVLVHDSIEMLQKISDDFIQNNVDKVTLSRQLELVRNCVYTRSRYGQFNVFTGYGCLHVVL